ncbi:DNA (cytosine-5-)-methyltransferase [Bradyrhizobium sp. 183]|uniref:DNA (cytosine-5-)-methyltransferase n=1 Tax=unclassified Bradyrhizobium TaxID=2631580 RepID=UPI00206C0663|nr:MULTISPECIES: DNA (cytosine-5-)-methyltransferase [unclassified Bradyrhizobium]UPJ83222.1 DNA (cytosine-5-)-methyltransferase [Bradyrhizobium sp. 184]UPJ91014.1 DNA (cytosine-5-)-methyltransferase [Bradyrhizobium sp. 183]
MALKRKKKPAEFKRLRELAGLTIPETAELIKVAVGSVYRYERGESRPTRLALDTMRQAAERRLAAEEVPTGFRFIDLFAGIGGLRLGFQAVGGRCVFTSEWDKKCQETYAMNFPDNHKIAGDIREYSANPESIPEHDVLLAGFPCQPFSIAGVSKKNALGRPHGFLCDTQGTLFFDTAQIIAHHKPAAFVLENVKNLERHDQGRTFATIINVLENELGYKVQYRVIGSQSWVPQKRERIFIVGFRNPTKFSLKDLKIPDAARGPKLGSILLPPDEVDAKYTLTPNLWKYLQDYKAKHNAAGNGFGFGLFGPDDVTRTLSARYYKDGSEILVKQRGNRPRRLTPRECARLMGFETDKRQFRICVSDTQAYKQFGNAVVVPVVEFIARALKPHIEAALHEDAPEKETAVRKVTRPPRQAVAA